VADTVDKAGDENFREVGRSLSAQELGILRKTVEVDGVLRRNDEVRRRVFAVHAEL
jgi:predicted RNase H-like nuclease